MLLADLAKGGLDFLGQFYAAGVVLAVIVAIVIVVAYVYANTRPDTAAPEPPPSSDRAGPKGLS